MSLTLKLETPHARIFPADRNFSNAVTTAERSVTPVRPMQQIEIEIISTETSKAPLARACDAGFRCMTWPHLGDQKYAIALTSDHTAD